ncbi:MAG: aminoacetone oxidase family FAD-binding enzyme [Clostridia bacterium]|nr:aminoacetone oxidase family FAD-binding enzyme [Clostridia bacterium]
MVTDVIIIGGGAAGLCSAVYLKQKNPELSVRILESSPRVCKKLALTGNGRCNISNKNINLSRYHGDNVEFCRFALEKYDLSFTENFFEKIGVPFVFEGDKAFPMGLQAASVVDCLRFAADNLGVITHLETKATNIQISNGKYKVICDNLSFLAENIIIATGLLSGGDRLGCDGSMLNVLKKAGFKTKECTPAIVQIKTETDIVKQLKGIKVNANATLSVSGKAVRTEFGEVLFCDYGLSGPPILQISREVSKTKEDTEIWLDIMSEYDFGLVYEMLKARRNNLSYCNLDEFFTGMLNKRLGQVVLKSVGLKLSDSVSELNDKKCKEIASVLKKFQFKAIGTTGFLNSQVTAGGLDTKSFNFKTMESRDAKGLYAVGEILDIDGDCGGFNLQWAWSSAFCASDNILKVKQ